MAKNKLKRRTIIRRSGTEPVDYIKTEQNTKSRTTYTNSKDYKYFWGHLIKDIAQQLPRKDVLCWKNERTLTLEVCAVSKFLTEKSYCKRCTLFQEDSHSIELRKLIGEWEKDDLEDEDES